MAFILLPLLFHFSPLLVPVLAAPGGDIRGRVVDDSGAVVPGATISLYASSGSLLLTGRSDGEGRFRFSGVPTGRYELSAECAGLGPARAAVAVNRDTSAETVLTLRVGLVSSSVTVTATRGMPEELQGAPNGVSQMAGELRPQRPALILPVLLREEPGVQIQQTSSHQGAVLIRGLTGQQVLHLIDGVRFNTSTFRPGPNQYLAMVDPAFIARLEVSRGPHSTQYGSDSLGGTLNVLPPRLQASAGAPRWRGELAPMFRTADLAGGGSLRLSYGAEKWHLLGGGSFRRGQDLRPGGGIDSHSVVARYLGLPSSLLGERMQDTAFTQWASYLRLYWNLRTDQSFSVTYHRSEQLGGRRYDQLNGGNGNLLNSFDPQTLDFAYARYSKQNLGWLDSLESTLSFNRQADARRFQGGSGNPLATINSDTSVTSVVGYQVQATTHLGRRHILLFGGEAYHEFIAASAVSLYPVTSARAIARARFPDGSRYASFGFFLQHSSEWAGGRLRTQSGLRASGIRFSTFARKNPVIDGRPTVPDFSSALNDLTWQAGASLRLAGPVTAFGSVSRGFRAPNATDYSQVGLTSAGFEVSPDVAAAASGFLGNDAGASAVSTGVATRQLRPESLLDVEGGLRWQQGPVSAALTGFHYNLRDFLTRRTLILPSGAVGTTLAGERVTQQLATGAVITAADLRPVITRANAGRVRLRGFEAELQARLTTAWTLQSNLSYLHGKDLESGQAPDLEGGLPPLHGFLSLRWQRTGMPWWVETFSHWSDAQGRLSSLERADQRIGAVRTRNSIAAFFQNGAVVRGLVAGGILLPTGETLVQVQDRVLGAGVQGAPLFGNTPGFATLNFRGGYRFGEGAELVWVFENALDKNYRLHGSGIDSPGRNLQVTYLWRF